MLEWQGIEFRILKLKLHSCTAYRVVGASVGGWHGYRLSYVFQGIGPNGRGDGYCASVERGAGSGEQGFLILIFKISDNHGEGDLLPWIKNI
jgi:hypothetical protein